MFSLYIHAILDQFSEDPFLVVVFLEAILNMQNDDKSCTGHMDGPIGILVSCCSCGGNYVLEQVHFGLMAELLLGMLAAPLVVALPCSLHEPYLLLFSVQPCCGNRGVTS